MRGDAPDWIGLASWEQWETTREGNEGVREVTQEETATGKGSRCHQNTPRLKTNRRTDPLCYRTTSSQPVKTVGTGPRLRRSKSKRKHPKKRLTLLNSEKLGWEIGKSRESLLARRKKSSPFELSGRCFQGRVLIRVQ